ARRASGLSAPSAPMMTSAASRRPSLPMTARTIPSPSASTAVILAWTGTAPAATAASRRALSETSRGTPTPCSASLRPRPATTPRHPPPRTAVPPPRKAGELPAPPGRAARQQIAPLARVGNADAQLRQHLHAARPDQVAARLVAGKGGLVGQRDAGAAAGEHQRGDAAGRPRSHHHRVKGRRGHLCLPRGRRLIGPPAPSPAPPHPSPRRRTAAPARAGR